MHETVREGKAAIRIKKAEKISKEMEVFYNPVMKLNRDISVLLLRQFPPMSLCDPLAASGVRSIRFAKELKHKSIAINDVNKKAVESIKNNLKFNKLNNNKKLKVYNEDTNLFLLESKGFDYIDIDPFGSSNYYLDAAIKRISRNGILAVTNTDTAALTGTYPNACIRKYWAAPRRDYMMHETGLRILIRKVQLIGMQYEKALIPIFSYFKDHYFRAFFRCIKGKKETDKIAQQHGMLNGAGPLWLGSLWDKDLASKMHGTLLKSNIKIKNIIKKNNNYKNIAKFKRNPTPPVTDWGIARSLRSLGRISKNANIPNIDSASNHQSETDGIFAFNNFSDDKELLKFLKTIKEESKLSIAGFYDIHNIAEKLKLKTIPKKEEIIKEIIGMGHKAASTHFSGTGVRTDISYDVLTGILKQ